MANISYEILYVPNLPLKQEPFEYLDGTGTFKIRFEVSVGNDISDFNSGFIRIKNSKTENNILSSKYQEQVIPFSNKKYGYNKSIIEKEKINIPIVKKDSQGYYVDLPKKIFGENLMSAQTNIKDMILNQNLSVQIALTKDIISAGYKNTTAGTDVSLNRDGSGQGQLVKFNTEKQKWEYVLFNEYFNGDILAKGISSWSATSTLNILTETKYTLVYPENKKKLESINSPITEFNGIRLDNAPISCTELNLKKFKIKIYDDELENKQLIDESEWITSDGISELNIIWQNKKELYDKHNYLIRLTICNYFDFYKDFDFPLKTIFQDSEFKADFKVRCNHDLARNELELKIKSPLYWGPDTNISLGDNDYANIDNDGIKIEQGINLVPNKGSWSGEFIFSNITPIDNWEQKGDDYFLKIQTNEPSNKNPYQFMYCLYALSTPTSFDVNYKKNASQFSPYEEDILWNPVLQSYDNNSVQFQLFLDSSDDLYDSDDVDTLKNNRVLTLGYTKTEKQPTTNVLYVRQYNPNEGFINKWWEIMINSQGEVKLQEASNGIGKEFTPKPIYLYDPIKHLITEMGVQYKDAEKTGLGHEENGIINPENYRIFFDSELRSFIPGRTKRPTYINEFRLVKRIFNYSSGVKTEIENQTYRAYLTGPNQKLMNWNLIDPSRQYYFHIREKKGQIQLSVADITQDSKEKLDRYNALSNGSSIGLLNDQILNMRGLDGNSYMIQRKSDGTPLYYNLSIDAMGIPNVDFGSLSSITITYEPLLNEDIGLSSNIIKPNNNPTNEDFLDFDEIVADVVINEEVFLKDYRFKAFSEKDRPYYMQPLKDFAKRIEEEKFEDDNQVILFLTDQHYQENRDSKKKNVIELYEKQYDAIDCVLELSNMTKIDTIIFGGDNNDGCGLKADAKNNINFINNRIQKYKNPYTKIGLAHGNHDYNTIGVVYGSVGRDKNNKITPSKYYEEGLFSRDEYFCFVDDNVIRYDSGCGYFIQNNILYLFVDNSDTQPKFDNKNNLILDPSYFYGYSTEQLNDISNILYEQGSKVENIIIVAHIPFDYKISGKDIEKNTQLLEEIINDYHSGLRNKYRTVDGNTQLVSKTPFENIHHAKITLSLHGHTHRENYFKKNNIHGFTANASLNAKRDDKYQWVQRVGDNTENMTCFKAIIYSSTQKMYKILNFGYKNQNTLDNFIMEV